MTNNNLKSLFAKHYYFNKIFENDNSFTPAFNSRGLVMKLLSIMNRVDIKGNKGRKLK